MNPHQKIVFIHSLNNYTGSPNVLSVIIKGFVSKGYEVEVMTSKGAGFLSDIPRVSYHYTCYRWTSNKGVTFMLFLLSQLRLFFHLIFYNKKATLFYINTIIPFGAVLACWITGKQYVYHVHENMQQQKPLYYLLRWVYRLCNRKSVFVSHYLKGTALNCKNGLVVHNCLDESFLSNVRQPRFPDSYKVPRTIIMVSSLRRFKGVFEFAKLALMNPDYTFELVVSATEEEVDRFRQEVGNISNLVVYPIQRNLHPFYSRAGLLLQLSHPESWVETFGMTVLEAMAYGIPCIVPNVGGPTELVEDGVHGFTVNPHNLSIVSERINELLENPVLHKEFAMAAFNKSMQFNARSMVDRIETYIG